MGARPSGGRPACRVSKCLRVHAGLIGSGGRRMKHNIIAAVILGICLIVAAFLFGGRYYFIRSDKCIVIRGDRWTGETEFINSVHCETGFMLGGSNSN